MMPFQAMRLRSGVTAPPYANPPFSTVQALLHMDGANGSSTFTDVLGGTFTRTGNAQISTARSVYGGASGLFDGSGDYVTRTYSTTAFDWWTTEFQLELYVYISSYASAACLIGNMQATGPTNYWSFGVNAAGNLQFFYYNGSSNFVTSSGTVSLGSFQHLVMTHSGGTIKVGHGSIGGIGVLDGSAAFTGTPQSSAATTLTIGQVNGVCHNGNIDELRIAKGSGAVTISGTNYTVPASAFPNS